MGCLYIYMQALHGVDAVCIGVPVHGRRTRLQKKTIGMLTQVVPVGLRPDAGTSFKELLGYVKQTLRSDLRHARSFLSSIVNQAAARWDTIGSPFEIVARFLAYDYNVDFGAIRSEGIVLENDFADTPLVATLRHHAHDALLTLTIKARSDVFDDKSIIKFASTLRVILHAAASASTVDIRSLDLIRQPSGISSCLNGMTPQPRS